MLAVRRFLAQRRLATLLCAATLLLRLFVPAGFMIGEQGGRVTFQLCSGMADAPMAMAMPGDAGDAGDHQKTAGHGKAAMPCAFSGLGAMALGAIDPVQLAALLAFVMAAGRLSAVRVSIARRAYLRPPLRGPPILL